MYQAWVQMFLKISHKSDLNGVLSKLHICIGIKTFAFELKYYIFQMRTILLKIVHYIVLYIFPFFI